MAVTQPANGTRVTRRSTVTINASASDSSGIAKVAFFVNNELRCVSPFAPYSCAWTVPNTAGTYTRQGGGHRRRRQGVVLVGDRHRPVAGYQEAKMRAWPPEPCS